MHQRSDSSVKGFHRGRQQRESADSSYRTVAAAGAEAAQRSLDRVHELSWQTIERGVQLGVAMFGCLALALAMNGWPDERNDEVQGHRILREGHAQTWECTIGESEMRIWTVGLEPA